MGRAGRGRLAGTQLLGKRLPTAQPSNQGYLQAPILRQGKGSKSGTGRSLSVVPDPILVPGPLGMRCSTLPGSLRSPKTGWGCFAPFFKKLKTRSHHICELRRTGGTST